MNAIYIILLVMLAADMVFFLVCVIEAMIKDDGN
jgi:hypothetical protein